MSYPRPETIAVNPEQMHMFVPLVPRPIRTLAYIAIAQAETPLLPIEVTDRLLTSLEAGPEDRKKIVEAVRQQTQKLDEASLIQGQPARPGSPRPGVAYSAVPEKTEGALAYAGMGLAWRGRSYQRDPEIDLEGIWGRTVGSPDKSPAGVRLQMFGRLLQGPAAWWELVDASGGSHVRTAVWRNIAELVDAGCIEKTSVFDFGNRGVRITATADHLSAHGYKMSPEARALYETGIGLGRRLVSAQFLVRKTVEEHPDLDPAEIEREVVHGQLQHFPFDDRDPRWRGDRTSHELSPRYEEPMRRLFSLLDSLKNDPNYARQAASYARQILESPREIAALLHRAGFAVTNPPRPTPGLPKQG